MLSAIFIPIKHIRTQHGIIITMPHDKAADIFTRFTSWCAKILGRPWAFILSLMLIVGWAILGPYFKWSDTHQLVINTATTIITFLMVFIIQNTQNRDNLALQLKLDELLKASQINEKTLLGIEDKPDKVLESKKRDMEK